MASESKSLDDRSRTIIEAVGNLLRSWDAWAEDSSTQVIRPTSQLAAVLDVAITTCCYGDIPEVCRDICQAMETVRVAHEDYLDGEFQPQTMEPLPVFYHAIKTLSEAVSNVQVNDSHRTVIESVTELRKQGLNDEQVARAYGAFNERLGVWVGPFFNSAGRIRADMIEAEVRKPGSIITDDFQHPANTARQSEILAIKTERTKRFKELEDVNKSERSQQVKPRPTDEQVIEYLKEGGFPHQLQHDYTITIAEINEIALRAKLAVQTPDTYTPASKDEPGSESLTETANLVEQQQQSAPANDATAIRQRVYDLHDAGKSPNDIATVLSTEFKKSINSQRVVAYLRAKPAATPVS